MIGTKVCDSGKYTITKADSGYFAYEDSALGPVARAASPSLPRLLLHLHSKGTEEDKARQRLRDWYEIQAVCPYCGSRHIWGECMYTREAQPND